MRLSIRILLGFSIVLILSIIDTGSNYLLSLKVEQNTEFLNKSENIIRNSGNLNSIILGMQSSLRGYLLTEDSSFLEGYNRGLNTVPLLVTRQSDLVSNNPKQSAILDSIETLHVQWVNYADGLIKSRMQSGISNDQYLKLFEGQLKKQVGKKLNDQIAVKFSDFNKIEYAVRDVHSDNLKKSIKRTHIFSLTFFALTLIIGVATTYYIVSLISKRIRQMVNLADNISKGNFITVIDDRNDELTDLSTSLNTMSVSLQKNISELESRNVELDKFAYVVSHDLKAPIRGIHNVLQWINEDLTGELSPEMNKYINIISGRVNRMENLINGLLDYARIREKTQPEHIDVKKLVEEIVQDIVPRNFKVELQNLPVIFGERIKIEQVFTNLISNAVKYTSAEEGEIVVSCQENRSYYEFSIKDNGIGIDSEFHGRIFEMFQTLREKGEKESTGIGLAIIKKIIEEQKGSIIVQSTPGDGAKFVFTWPRINETHEQ
jgi:signal transduction histidine kinase